MLDLHVMLGALLVCYFGVPSFLAVLLELAWAYIFLGLFFLLGLFEFHAMLLRFGMPSMIIVPRKERKRQSAYARCLGAISEWGKLKSRDGCFN